jgi:lipopolysaccharide biosynthesis regulator YciM
VATDHPIPDRRDAVAVDARNAEGVVAGDHNTQNNFFGHAVPPVRSAYLEQVRRIAPKVLVGRERELAELADFCTGQEPGPYVWWRAPAWAGKSALMSWFVLHPPPGVRVVSFFVTARYPGQSERSAFVDNVLEQLAELLGQRGKPAYLTDTTRDAHLLAMLTDATHRCGERGQRLVLLLDGLDEDLGVTLSPDVHSIAALLPASPPAGLRIVVAGRPDPPIPSDIPDDHPLRDPGIVRVLDQSPQAAVARTDAERELKRLLHGDLVEQELLGLLTAAGGGVSGRDLAELTGQEQWRIEDLLHTARGRTFRRRPSRWQPDTAPEVYVLAHEELHAIAERFLGPTRLDGYQRRLHTWAAHYRSRGWPANTPEYLLRGYYRLLEASSDLPEMIAYATDPVRHDRMRSHTGGDATALEEITSAQDAILAQPEPDLLAMCRLAMHRDGLAQRNVNIPLRLPAVWAALGHLGRAEALVESISDVADRRAVALSLLVPVVEAAGDHDRAEALARMVPEHTFVAPSLQAQTLSTLTESVAKAGDYDRAEVLANSISDPYWQARAHGEVALALGAAGDPDEAEIRARAVAEPYWQAQVLGVLAKRAAKAGRDDRAATLAAQAEALACAVADVHRRTLALGFLSRLAGDAGDHDRAVALAGQAETLVLSITDPKRRAAAATKLAPLVAAAGDHSRVEALLGQAELSARSITGSYQQADALAALVPVTAEVGDHDRAEALARSITDPSHQVAAFADLTSVLASAGHHARAEALARSISEPHQQAKALTTLVSVFASAGDHDRAEAVAGSITDPQRRAAALTEWASVLAAAGDHNRAAVLAEQAETMARSTIEPYRQAKALIELTSVLAAAGDRNRAAVLAGQAETMAHSITNPTQQADVFTTLVPAAIAAGDHDRAEAVTRSITDPQRRAAALTQLTSVLAASGNRSRSVALAEEAEAAARSITNSIQQAAALTKLASQLALVGEYDRAEAVARSIADPNNQEAMTDLMRTAAAAGEYDRAEALARSINSSYRAAKALTKLTSDLADVGEYDRAEAVARSITDRHLQAQALIALAQKADPPRARALVAWALRHREWSEPLNALALVHPDAVLAVADRFLHAVSNSKDRQVVD